ncbi:Protein 21.1 [Giardia lamblia P15]|uniref:Protein 21.1 n=1 Tax=Giardia intestinalis (strain P15) TaxID=658858 RepID=E1EW88_GIAIA|nr:Protein 21.1 [Giardia lamblia P15]
MHLSVIAEKYTNIQLSSELQGIQIHSPGVITRRLYSAVSLETGKPINILEYDVAELSLEARRHLVMNLERLADIGSRLSEMPGSCLALHGNVMSYGREGFIYQEVQHGRSLTDEIVRRRSTGSGFSELEVWEILAGVVTAINSLRKLDVLNEPLFFTPSNILLLEREDSGQPLSVLVCEYMDSQIHSLSDLLFNHKQYNFSLPLQVPSPVANHTLSSSLNESLVWNIGTLLLKIATMKPFISSMYAADGATDLPKLLSERGFSGQLISVVSGCLEHDVKKREHLEKISNLVRLKTTAHLVAPIQPYEHTDGDTDLMQAAALNDTDTISLHISSARSQNKHGRTALMLAAERGHLEAVKLLASHELQLRDENGMTALMYAAIAGRANVVSYLVITGSQLEASETGVFSSDHHCALMYAIIHNRAECVRILAPAETNARIPETEGETVLMWAVHKKEEAFLVELADAAASCESSSDSGKTALMLAAITGFTAAINILLFQARKSDTHGRTALMYAVLEGNTDAVELLAPHECKQHDDRGEMAIIKAMRAEDINMVKILLPHEGKGHTGDGLTPLMVAAKTANRRVFDLLINETWMVPASDGTTILDYLSWTGNTVYRKAVLTYAKMHGAFLTLSSRKPSCVVEHKTQLMEAAEQNRPDLVAQYLDQAGRLLPGFVSQGCGTALMMAINNRNIDCASLLVEREAGIQTKEGLTALMRAAEMDYTTGVKLLLEYETTLRDWNGWCALMWAASKNNVSCVRLLLSEQDLQNNTGKTALQVAQVTGQEAAISILSSARK